VSGERPTRRRVIASATSKVGGNRQRQLMKSGLLILAVVAIVTGVAGDLVMGPSRPFPRVETKARPALSPSTTSDPAGRADAVETRHQPVPVLWTNERRSLLNRSIPRLPGERYSSRQSGGVRRQGGDRGRWLQKRFASCKGPRAANGARERCAERPRWV